MYSVTAKAAFIRHGRTRHGGLQAGHGAGMALRVLGILQVLAVLLHESVEFVATSIQNTSEIERNVGRVVLVALAVFVRPVPKKLALVSAFFRNLDGVFAHKSCAMVGEQIRIPAGFGAFACT